MTVGRRIVAFFFAGLTLIPTAIFSLFCALVWASDNGSPDGGREWAVAFFVPFTILWALVFGNFGLMAAGERSMFLRSFVCALALWVVFWLLAAIPGELGTALGISLIIGLNCAAACYALLVLVGFGNGAGSTIGSSSG